MISAPIQIRFADVDLAGHVHNAAYLHYFESARIHFFVSELGTDWDWMEYGILVKKNTVEYEAPVFLEEKIHVEVKTSHIGNKSFTLHYTVKNQQGEVKTTGESLLVCFNHREKRTTDISPGMRAVLEKHA